MAAEAESTVYNASVIIPHYAGSQVFDCIESVLSCPDRPAEVILIDDASTDGTAYEAAERYPSIRVARNRKNFGFVGACNRGIAEALYQYAVLLNDDAIVEPGWLAACIEALESDPELAAVQPKIVQAADPSRFEYAGAAGGLIDRFGYPYALGRWFETVETDTGQYDAPRDIFWASGVAIALRRSVALEIGALDTTFVMHMEEIDWCWRAWIAGYRVRNVPTARVRHIGAKTLAADSFRKMYLNHRNSFMMVLKNTGTWALFWIVPIRTVLELITFLGALVTGRFRRAAAAITALFGVLGSVRHIRRERRRIATFRRRSDREVARMMYRGSIALRYLFGRRAPILSAAIGSRENGGTA
jgi:GT2 family glycosyltransferase